MDGLAQMPKQLGRIAIETRTGIGCVKHHEKENNMVKEIFLRTRVIRVLQ